MKRAIHHLGVYATILWLAFAGKVCGSGEGGVGIRFESVVIVSDEAGYRFSMKMDAEDTLELIEVDWEGRKLSFSKKDFGRIKPVFVRGVKMVTPTPYSSGKQDTVIMVLPYNKERVGSDKDKTERYQFDVVRLHFSKGKLDMWEKAESIEGRPGYWKLTSKGEIEKHVVDGVDKVDAQGVHDSGEAEREENPYLR